MHAEGGEWVEGRGAVLICAPAPGPASSIATTQFETALSAGHELVAFFPALDEAIGGAFELAGWIRAAPGESRAARIVVVEARGEQGPLEALRRAKDLLPRARPGQPWLDSETAERHPASWVATEFEEGGLALLRWTGPGSSPQAGPIEAAPSPPAPMVGRREELRELASSWSEVCEAGSRLVLLSGEPGAGKTRLVNEAALEIAMAGGQVLYGAGDEVEGGPYAPFVAALGRARLPEAELPLSFTELVRGVEKTVARPPSAGLGAERSAPFSAAVQELEQRCRAAPTALVIEDLHNCDASSVQLLKHLATSRDLSRLLIIGTYRHTDLDPESLQAEVLAQLRASPRVSQIELRPLGARSLRGLAASFGVDRSMLDRVAELATEETAGLPLYACELFRNIAASGSIEAGESVTRPLQILISSRVRSVGAKVHEHLSVAAVAGTSFDPGVVAAAAGVPPAALAESLQRAERAGLVRSEAPSGDYSFGHALTRRCLYEELNRSDRGRMHSRIANAMEDAIRAGEPLEPGRVAQQWELARPRDKARAADWAVRAAEAALARFDPEAAVRWYERALELDDRGGPDDAERRCDLLLGLGAAHRLDGSARFRELLLEAARLAIELDDPTRLAAATLTNSRGFVSAIGEFDRERLAMLELAAGRVEDESLRPLVLAELALELTFAPERERRRELAESALALARETDDPKLLARVLIRCLIARWEPGNARERIKLGDESIKVGSQLDDPLDLFHGLHWRAAAQIEAGELAAAHRSIQEESRIAARLGDPTAAWLAVCSRSLRHALAGRLQEAEAEAEQGATLGRDSDQPDALPFYASQIASIRWQQGRLGELAPLLNAALEHHPGLPGFRSLVALTRLASGDTDGAREVIAVDSAERFETLPRDPTWFAGVVTYAHVAAELDDERSADPLHALLQPLLGRLATTSVSVWGLTDHAVGRLAATLGDGDEAVKLLDRSIHEYARLPTPVWRGQAAVDLALVLRRLGREPERADELLAEARATGERYGAQLLTSVPTVGEREERDLAPSAADRLEALDLTNRQREILALIARGMSNAEIAGELAISPSTVKRHAEDMFARTGVRGRKGLMALLYD